MKTNSGALIVPSPAPPATTNVTAETDIRDIKAPVPIPLGWLWLWCVLGAMAVAALSYFAWRYWQKHRAKAKPLEVVIPPHERARRKLQEALKLIYEPRPFCIAVSDTLRTYLEEAFSLRAPERTTEEFLEELQSSSLLSFPQKQSLGDFLMRCDLVKFARDEPTVEQLKELHESALRLVDQTSYFQPRPEMDSSSAGQSPTGESGQSPSSPSEVFTKGGPSEQQPAIGNRQSTTP
jgi:hypothetical protein